MSKEIKYLCVFLLFIGILKFCFFTNIIIPVFDSYEFLLVAKSLWLSHSFLIDSGLDYKFASVHEIGYSLLIALFYPFFHDFEISARFVTVMSGILSIFFIYLLMEKIKKGTGKFAAFLLVTSSLHLMCSTMILRDIPSLCFIVFILYYFYGRPISPIRTILLGILIGLASLIHLTNAALLIPFLYLLIKEKKVRWIPLFLGSYSIILFPYVYMRFYKWPFSTIDVRYYCYSKGIPIYTVACRYLRSIFLKYLHWEPLIFIFGLAGVFLIFKKDIARQLRHRFWGIYLFGYLCVFLPLAFKTIGIKTFEDSYLIPFLPPLILTASIYLNEVFNPKSTPSGRILWINGIGTCFILVFIATIHWPLKGLFISKWMSLDFRCRFIFLSFVILAVIVFFIILFSRRNAFPKLIITGILIGFAIQVSDEVIKIKGRHLMTTRGKELSFDINMLKGKVLPQDAFLVGLKDEDAFGILYHAGYPLFYEDLDRATKCYSLGKKWYTKTMDRVINLSWRKPVICVYDHLYRYYLSGLGEELYESIQEKYQDKLCFSNLKLNSKVYLLDNIATASYYDRFYKKGVDYYLSQLRTKPDDINLLNYLGWAYLCQGDFDKAINTWRKKETITPKDADVHNNLGIAYYRKGDYQQAIVEYNKALELKPVDDPHRVRWARAMIYFNLAQAYEKANEKKKAIIGWKNYYESIPYPENKAIMEKYIKRIREQNDFSYYPLL